MTTERKPVKRAWLRGILVLLLSAAVLLFLVIYVRPKWQTLRLPLEAKGSTLIVEIPIHWTWEPSHHAVSTYSFYPPPPTGVLRWWNAHILKMDMTEAGIGRVSFSVNQRPAETALDGHKEMEMVARTLVASYQRPYKEVKTTWSSRFGMQTFDMEARQTRRATSGGPTDVRVFLLNDYDPIAHRSAIITVWMHASPQNYSHVKPTMNEIIRRLRLVQNK